MCCSLSLWACVVCCLLCVWLLAARWIRACLSFEVRCCRLLIFGCCYLWFVVWLALLVVGCRRLSLLVVRCSLSVGCGLLSGVYLLRFVDC